MDGRRLDVTWLRVERGAQTYVFEVQVGGSLVKALVLLADDGRPWLT